MGESAIKMVKEREMNMFLTGAFEAPDLTNRNNVKVLRETSDEVTELHKIKMRKFKQVTEQTNNTNNNSKQATQGGAEMEVEEENEEDHEEEDEDSDEIVDDAAGVESDEDEDEDAEDVVDDAECTNVVDKENVCS